MPIIVDRVSLNGKRYIASESYEDLKRLCELKGISVKWIRYSKKHKKHYLCLWGRWKRC